jgi:hypothetical protein
VGPALYPAMSPARPMGTTASNNFFLEVRRAYQILNMEKILWTPRLKLTLFETLEEGSKDLEWAHAIRTDEKAMTWRLVFPPQSLAYL